MWADTCPYVQSEPLLDSECSSAVRTGLAAALDGVSGIGGFAAAVNGMLDDTDRKLIEALQEDSRTSMRKLAEKIGVSFGTVGNRLVRLEERGVIKGYGVRLDADKIGWDLTVVIGLRIVKGQLLVFAGAICLIIAAISFLCLVQQGVALDFGFHELCQFLV